MKTTMTMMTEKERDQFSGAAYLTYLCFPETFHSENGG